MDSNHESNIETYPYIVVGGGIAGVTCTEHIFILDPESPILLLTATDVVKTATNVLPLTKYLDSFDIEEQANNEFQDKFTSVNVVKSCVKHIDTNRQVVHTSTGKQYHYRKLCICAGASANSIAPENPFVIIIRDTESVLEFQKRISEAKRIIIVGNGGIATELVFELTGMEVVWAIKDKSINSVFMDPGAAEFLKPELSREKDGSQILTKRNKYTVDSNIGKNTESPIYGGALGPDWHNVLDLKGNAKRDVRLETEVEIEKIYYGHGITDEFLRKHSPDKIWPVYAELTNNKIYGCDFIVSATGVTPNTDFLLNESKFNLSADGGLIINDKMETSVPNIYAAGDVCTAGWTIAKHWHQIRLWTQARQMGSYAAKCMWSALSGNQIYMDFCFEMFTHATKFFGLKVILLGLFNGHKLDGKYDILLRTTKGKEYIKCVMFNGKMQGAVLIGETDLEETFENLILNQMDLTIYGEDLLDPSIDIEDYFD